MDSLTDALRVALLAVPLFAAAPGQARAEELAYTSVVESEVDWAAAETTAPQTARLASDAYGPFRVRGDVIELVDAVTSETPLVFKALLANHPGVKRIEMIDCPGSEDDDANLALARMIRARSLETHVPEHGSIRSGGVELFLAGVKRTVEPGAEIGVHSWEDSDGLQATDYAANDPVHRPYLSFYADMGMTPERAREFYDFTNKAAPFDGLHVMTRSEMDRFGLTTTS